MRKTVRVSGLSAYHWSTFILGQLITTITAVSQVMHGAERGDTTEEEPVKAAVCFRTARTVTLVNYERGWVTYDYRNLRVGASRNREDSGMAMDESVCGRGYDDKS